MTDVMNVFGSTFNKFSMMYGIAASVPTSGAITLGSTRGKSASVPTMPATTKYANSASGVSGTYALSATDAYGAPLTYAMSGGVPAGLSSASVSSSGTLSYTAPANTVASANISVQATNRFGKVRTTTVTVTMGLPPVASSTGTMTGSVGDAFFGTASGSTSLSSLFTSPVAQITLYSIVSSPYGNNTYFQLTEYLAVTCAQRNTSYGVVISATNAFGTSTANATVNVTELAAISAPSGSIWPIAALTGTSTTLTGKASGNGTYTVSASSYLGTNVVVNAFNKVTSGADTWSSTQVVYATDGTYIAGSSTNFGDISSANGEWLQLTLPGAIVVGSFAIWPFSLTGRSPYNIVLAGATNGVDGHWTRLFEMNNVTGWTVGTKKTFTLTVTPSAFHNFRIIAKSTQPNSDNGTFCVAEWELYAK